jgi:hypothetical protein
MFSKNDVVNYVKAKEQFDAASQKILDRIDEVLTSMQVAFEFKPSEGHCWWFPDAEEGEVGTIPLDAIIGGDEIHIEHETNDDMSIDGLDYSSNFPSDFLYLTEEEIVAFIHKEKQKAAQKKLKNASKYQQGKAKRETLRKAALAKLTPEEQRAILRKTP